jgi:hypothetical protein
LAPPTCHVVIGRLHAGLPTGRLWLQFSLFQVPMAILSIAKCSESSYTEAQAQGRMQQLHEATEQMRQATDVAQLQYGEASQEYRAALDQWGASLQYFERFINELVTASNCQEASSSKSSTGDSTRVTRACSRTAGRPSGLFGDEPVVASTSQATVSYSPPQQKADTHLVSLA